MKENAGHKNLEKRVKFTKENQPKNRGRKPSRFKSIMKQLDREGEKLSVEDLNNIIKVLLTMSVKDIEKLAKDKKTPTSMLIIASSIAGDIESRQIVNLDKLLDRVFGKALEKSESTIRNITPAKVLTKKEAKELFENCEKEY